MQKKFPLDDALLQALSEQPLLAAYVQINHLKQLYRQGWLRVGMPREACESVADHVFAMTMLAWMVIDAGLAPGVDREKVLHMVLAHELGEIYAGDLTPYDGVPPEEKQRRERASIQSVAAQVPSGGQWVALWEEFEAGESAEAMLVNQLDRLEMALQAQVYEWQGHSQMDNFYESARRVVQSEELRRLLETVTQRRER